MRGRELPVTETNGREDAQRYMQECYLGEGEDSRNEPAVLVRAATGMSSTVTITAGC